MKRLLIPIFVLFTALSALYGQEVTVTAAFDSSRIFIGDQVNFIITVDQPSNLRLSISVFKDTLCKNIEILNGPQVDSTTQSGRTIITEKYLITSFDSGFYQVQPIFAEMKNENGLKRFYSDYSQLEVMRVKIAPADTTIKIYDIIRPYKATVTIGEILPWLLLVLLLSAAGWFAYIYYRKIKRSKPGVEIIVNPDPAHVIAFRELEKLKKEKLWENGEVKYYYTRLTEILRQYLENRYKVFSLELTTGETLDALVKTGFKKDGAYTQVKTVLTMADLVKFAKYSPGPSDNELNFKNSWDFILSTKEDEVMKNSTDEKAKGREGSS